MKPDAEKKLIGRRNFLKAAAVLPAIGAVSYKAQGIGPVKTGIVGAGMEGRILMSLCDPKFVYLTALCDIRPDNRALGLEMLKKPELGHDPNARVYEKYEDLLNDPGIEAVMIATPFFLHGPMALQALEAGKHVFVEKTMAYTIDECLEMTRLAKAKGLNLQVGHQRFYNPLYWDAYRMIQEGLLGEIHHVRALWHRNTDWNYWTHFRKQVPADLQKQLRAMDPTRYGFPDLQHLVNWRWYETYSRGLWTELCSHQIAVTNWFLGSIPKAVYAAGGKFKSEDTQNELYLEYLGEYQTKKKYNDTNAADFAAYAGQIKGYNRDDRDIEDHIFAVFEYPGNRIVTYSSIQSNSVDQYYEHIMGTRGSLILSNENESYLFWEPGWNEETAQKAAKEEKSTQVDMVKEDAGQSAFAAHVSQEATGKGGASGMSPTDPYRFELQGFAHTIRAGAPNLCDGLKGTQAALACFSGQESLKRRQRVEIAPLIV